MTTHEALAVLERAGTAQNRKIYTRHGVTGAMFGVSSAELGKIKKRIGTDQALAEALWAEGNHDARILATMIAEPSAIAAKTIDAWAKDLDSYVLTDALSGLVARSPHAHARAEKWIGARKEWIAAAGWNVLAVLAMRDGVFTTAELEGYLETIEAGIGGAKNRVRYAMNNALIAIGTASVALEKQAIAAATRIGVVQVDHGETGCKTPDAAAYIPKAAAHRRAKTKKQQKKKKKTGASRTSGPGAATLGRPTKTARG